MDDCGQLTIRCSQDYFSLDCGITAFELSDYSPGDEPETARAEPNGEDPDGCQQEAGAEETERSGVSNQEQSPPGPSADCSPAVLPTTPCGAPNPSESAKRPLQGVSLSTEASPTQPSLPKRAALFSDGGTRADEARVGAVCGLQLQAELSRSSPALMDPPDRSKFWLELDSVYPENVSQSDDSLQVSRSGFTVLMRYVQRDVTWLRDAAGQKT